MPYTLTILPDGAGGYVGRLDSDDGDLWVKLEQQPQAGEQFRRALVAFAEMHDVPYVVVEAARELVSQVLQIEMPADVEKATLRATMAPPTAL